MTVAAVAIPAARSDVSRSYRFCRDVTREQAKNFYYGLRLLPEPKRSAMFCLYAYMRMADDIADEDDGRSVDQRSADLEDWQARTNAAADGRPTRSGTGARLWPAFSDMVARYRLPSSVFDDVIQGQRDDLRPVPFETFPPLYEYCRRVAGVVGVASIHIWGFEGGDETVRMAVDRGVAFQLTNILRDLREDAARGRSYLPAEELAAYQLTPDAFKADRGDASFLSFMRFQIGRAEAYYRESAELENRISLDSRPTLRAMTSIYHCLLNKIARRPERVLRERVSLSIPRKLLIGWRAFRES